MHRKKILALLAAYNPPTPEENVYRETIRAFVTEHPDCFERSLEIGHITASCWLINADNSKALLTHHAKFDVWCQLGGHCDGDTDPLAVAIKEGQEESGNLNIIPVSEELFDIDVHLIPTYKNEKEHYHYDLRFLLQMIGKDHYVVSHESRDLAWVSKDPKDLPSKEQSVIRMHEKWINWVSPNQQHSTSVKQENQI